MKQPQSDGERLPRVWLEAFRRGEPDAPEIARAYRRFSARHVSREFRRPGRWLIPAIVLAAGTAYGATGSRARLFRAIFVEGRSELAGRQGQAREPLPAAAMAGAVSAKRAPASAFSASSLQAANPPSQASAGPTRSVARLPTESGASGAEPRIVQREAKEGLKPSGKPIASDVAIGHSSAGLGSRDAAAAAAAVSASAATSNPRDDVAPAAIAKGSWQRAAESMRNKDFAAAETALAEIEAHGRASEAEAARLTRAELLLATGRPAQAVQPLRDLAENSTSALVRERAKALLDRSGANR